MNLMDLESLVHHAVWVAPHSRLPSTAMAESCLAGGRTSTYSVHTLQHQQRASLRLQSKSTSRQQHNVRCTGRTGRWNLREVRCYELWLSLDLSWAAPPTQSNGDIDKASNTVSLSKHQFVDCASPNFGCAYGLMDCAAERWCDLHGDSVIHESGSVAIDGTELDHQASIAS